ncbi:hypothetical protein EV385_6598 [Krasilnikovia cinnamomea]|uniref:Uncharacterized protein n=1 Tax=Krasilnikovia cinnamomea TaxID=349313 RepID=A0A4Q7Z8Z9_9ACTN|nr:hypothetical protein [Krasilnikovia cinnamomea]RZU46524.1 hypothetical protein EV385_6598 [Krasilnikovia cinnamomea]
MDHALPAESEQDTLVGQAIQVLTALARQTRVRGAGTPDATTEPVDFADLAAHVLTATAANVGSVSTLLAGRSGSWEADLVRRLVDGTAGEDGDLLLWRTEPVLLQEVDAWDMFGDFGIRDLYDQESQPAVDRANDPNLTDAQVDAANDLVDALEALWVQDQAAYVEGYRATAARYLTERGATCGVEVVDALPSAKWDGLTELVHEYAREHTPLPMTGAAPDWSDGTPADAVRRAGLTYTARVQGGQPTEGEQ